MEEDKYIGMIIFVDQIGKQTPMGFVTKEGRKILINHCRGRQNRASRKVGGVGIQYECEVGNKIVYFYDDDGRWFYEVVT